MEYGLLVRVTSRNFFQFGKLVSGGIFGIIDFAVGFLELILEFAKILSFSFRLFGNIFAGVLLAFDCWCTVTGGHTAWLVPVRGILRNHPGICVLLVGNRCSSAWRCQPSR